MKLTRRAGRRGLELAAGLALGGLALLARRRPLDLRGRVVLITGGSRGLGLVLARRFAAAGARLALIARDPLALDRAAAELRAGGAEALPLPCDVRVRDQVEDAVRRVVLAFGRLDVLVNGAGVIQVGPLEHMTPADFEDAMAVHAFGPLHTTLAALPHLRASGAGRVVNITSIGGKVAVPHLLPYTASKFAAVGLSDGLRVELRRQGIRVTTVCPGLMRTGSAPNALFKGRHRAEHAWFALGAALPLVSIDADRAAARIVRACRRGDARLIITPQAKAAALLNELAPGLVTTLLSVVNRLLPRPAPGHSPETHPGHDSASFVAPSWLTRLADRASEENNELAGQR
ncbi:MAG: SDR family oxidoreductase [Planctomycetes bacterium]|nr:SDR family oxidoreductase [Planctomycetota bacterium]